MKVFKGSPSLLISVKVNKVLPFFLIKVILLVNELTGST
jgi:hypothetical protein